MGESAYQLHKERIEGERDSSDRASVIYTREELKRARKVFGPQFIPEGLDLQEGKNLENYGVKPEIFNNLEVLLTDLIRNLNLLFSKDI